MGGKMKRSCFAGLFALVAILSVTNGSGSRSANPQQTSTESVQVVEVTARKYEFNPSPIHVKQGNTVQLKITATDHTHGFKIGDFPDGSDKKGNPGLFFSSPQDCQKIEKGQSATVEFVARTPGTYSFKCCVRCGLNHGGMKGQLIVDP
jgi:heme/copper-type cytochrome/quinol oxidase subunit 2